MNIYKDIKCFIVEKKETSPGYLLECPANRWMPYSVRLIWIFGSAVKRVFCSSGGPELSS